MKIYEASIVNRDTRNLARIKTQLEIVKLREEAIALYGAQNDPLVTLIRAVELPFHTPKPDRDNALSPRTRARRILDRIGGIFLTTHDRDTLRAVYAAEAALWLRRGRAQLERVRLRRTLFLSLGIILSLLYVFTVFPNAIVDVYEAYDQESLLAAVFQTIMSVVLLRLAVRLAIKLRDSHIEFTWVLRGSTNDSPNAAAT